MGVANQLLAAVVVKLDETSFGTATVSKQLMPDVTKTGLSVPQIIVALQAIESLEHDRSRELVKYTVAIGVSYPVKTEAQKELALDMVEDVQNWLTQVANRRLTLAAGTACITVPFAMESVLDPEMYREAGIYFSHTNFTYLFHKNRS